MAKTPVKDVVIWAKHIHGEDVAARVTALRGGELIELAIDGFKGCWRKMSDGKDGRATAGIRPVGATQAFWKELYASRRGAVVEVTVVESRASSVSLIDPPLGRTPEERRNALEGFLSLAGQGYRSDGRTLTRDEMHED